MLWRGIKIKKEILCFTQSFLPFSSECSILLAQLTQEMGVYGFAAFMGRMEVICSVFYFIFFQLTF